MNIDEAIQIAVEHLKSGKLQQAEDIFKKILEVQSDNITAINLLGIIYYQLKNYDSAITYMRKLISLNPNNAQAYYILGHSMQEKGQIDEAITHYQKSLQLNPNFADAYYNLGTIFQDKKGYDEAISCYQKALQFNPTDIDATYNIGLVLQEKGQFEEAIIFYQKALQLNPNLVDAYNNLGLIFQDKQQLEESVSCFQKALQLNPTNIVAYYGLAVALRDKGQLQEAINLYHQSLQLIPNNAYVYYNIGHALMAQGKLNEAEEYYKHALQLNPNELKPYESLLMMTNYNSNYDAQKIFSKHLEFAKQFAEPLFSPILPHTNDPSPSRRLKIGYVSPDFKKHSVSYFIDPILASHNREHFEVFCYSNISAPDEVTRRIQGYADQWRNIRGIPDEQVAELIRKDNIDILVDLAGHTADNRILLFAYKPAPVQVTWIGYPCTTGLSTIDYKIVDNYTDPPGITEQFYTEKLIRLPESFLCYLPDKDSPEVGNLPSLTSEYITFGSFNNFAKVTQEIIALWAKILRAINNSRLIMKAHSLSDRTTRDYAMGMFIQEGIVSDRIKLLPWEQSTRGHLEKYNHVDIGLDTFPYNGTTTTCEAMWMGVPVITLSGDTPASRVGISLLSNIGLTELIATNDDEYVNIALHLASDTKKLQMFRERLRDIMIHSPLTDAKRFIMNLEKCYRTMWEEWCQST